jgi:hypothetical protein
MKINKPESEVKKTLLRISLISLILSYEPHRNVMQRVLHKGKCALRHFPTDYESSGWKNSCHKLLILH